METKIIIFLFLLVLITFILFLFKDSEFLNNLKGGKKRNSTNREVKQGMKNKVKQAFRAKDSKKPIIANAPVIMFEIDGKKNNTGYRITKEKTIIGSGENCDIVIESPEFDQKQIEIRRKIDGNEPYYELTNLSKYNRAEYLDKDGDEKGSYYWMGIHDTVELFGRDVFYVGNVKIKIHTPEQGHKLTHSDRMCLNKEREKDSDMEAVYENTGTSGSRGKREKSDRVYADADI